MSSSAPAVQTLDYGRSIDGIPAFEVLSAEGDTSAFEMTYAESKAALGNYMSDGPLPLAAAMDTYRVNRYNITGPGRITNRLIQGAFRYQKLNLSSPGVLKLRGVGVASQTDNTPPTDLPGFFHSCDATLNTIWTTGARTVQMTEIPKASVPEFWEVTPEGAVVDSLAPQVLGSAVAAQLLEYNVNFKVKSVKGGFGFVVLADTLNVGVYITCDVEAGRIAAHAGSTALDPLLQETALPSNLSVGLNIFLSVRAVVAMTEIAVFIDGTPVLQLSQTSRFFGSVGLGASFGHKAVFRDLSITNPTDDTTIYYAHPLTDPSFLPDFFLGTNPAAAVVDGSRRDRIAYAGDLDIADGASLASTHNLDALLGTLDLLGSYQAAPGFFIPTAKIQQAPLTDKLDIDVTGLIGYSFNFVTAVAATYMHTGDAAFAQTWAPKVQKMLDWAHSQTLQSNGLLNISDPSMGGDWNYYDPPQSGIVTKFNMLYAYSLQESLGSQLLADGGVADPGVYQTRLEKLRQAIDIHLWNDDLQAYVVSESLRTAFAQDANALAILAGVNMDPDHSTEKILSTLSTGLISPNSTGLRQLPLAFSAGALIPAAGFHPYASPYATAYHLRAALSSNASAAARDLLDSLWAPMADPQNANYTGTFWETLDASGRPGLPGLATSLCHGWSAGPTAELSRFVLGARPTTPGWGEFVVAPLTLGLRSAGGRVPLPLTTGLNSTTTMIEGGKMERSAISVQWAFDDGFNDGGGLFQMVVEAPAGTSGTAHLPRDLLVGAENSTFTVNGEVVEGGAASFHITGGTKFELRQFYKA
ncbi:Six-hairpin glycosidase-like protein [Apiospora sp. TS-2023a]